MVLPFPNGCASLVTIDIATFGRTISQKVLAWGVKFAGVAWHSSEDVVKSTGLFCVPSSAAPSKLGESNVSQNWATAVGILSDDHSYPRPSPIPGAGFASMTKAIKRIQSTRTGTASN
jgi:hypothetical protein